MSMRDILERQSDGLVLDTAQIFLEVYDDTTRRLKVTLSGDAQYTSYETGLPSPGSSADGYDVKNVGGLFGTVTTSLRTIIKNNDESGDITIYFNTDNTNPIVIKANAEFDLSGFGVTNIFIDTPSGYGSSIEIILFG